MTQTPSTRPASARTTIVGCGGLGSLVAASLAEQGHVVHVLDVDSKAFELLPAGPVESGSIIPLLGDGTRRRDLMKARVQEANVFMALTGSDTQNALAAQLAKLTHQVPTVICRVDDPPKQKVYNALGIMAVSGINLLSAQVLEAVQR